MQTNVSIFFGGPMGPIHPVWGHVLVSFGIFLLRGFASRSGFLKTKLKNGSRSFAAGGYTEV